MANKLSLSLERVLFLKIAESTAVLRPPRYIERPSQPNKDRELHAYLTNGDHIYTCGQVKAQDGVL